MAIGWDGVSVATKNFFDKVFENVEVIAGIWTSTPWRNLRWRILVKFCTRSKILCLAVVGAVRFAAGQAVVRW